MKKIVFILGFCFLSVLDPAMASADSKPQFSWDFFTNEPLNHARYGGLINLAENVKNRTNGNLIITLRPVGELPYKGPEVISITMDNSVQMAEAQLGNISGTTQVGAIPTYSFFCRNRADFKKMMAVILPIFQSEMKEHDIEVLSYFPDTTGYLSGKGEVITKISDFRGRNFRAINAYMQIFAKRAGANALMISPNELPQALNRSLIDMFATATLTIVRGSLYESIDWIIEFPLYYYGAYILINGSAWRSLPHEYQMILQDEAQKMSEYYWNEYNFAQDKKALEIIANYRNGKVKIYPYNEGLMQEGRELMKDYYDKWAEEAGPLAVKAIEEIKKAWAANE